MEGGRGGGEIHAMVITGMLLHHGMQNEQEIKTSHCRSVTPCSLGVLTGQHMVSTHLKAKVGAE
jgi:hypothetical protein